MDIVQSFYDKMAPQYDKLFLDREASVREQAVFISRLSRREKIKGRFENKW